MRAGCTSTIFQQSLTPEASSIVKQAMSLARRRGHAQVTPLHVATTMLSSPTGLLRAACIQSHSQSHPLRCRALDLCFNVALNRLPSSSQIIAGPYRTNHPPPLLSNALVAVFKRAQAHQRRGSTADMHQQAMLAVRIDVEQLIVSILDDPSVSRVMREAGFSSTQVKINVEKAASLEITSPEPNPKPSTSLNLDLSLNNHDSLHNQLRSKKRSDDGPLLEDGTRNELTALPPWLLQHREESRKSTITDQVSVDANDPLKWKSGYKHHPSEKTLDFLSSPSESQQTHQASSSNPNSTSSAEIMEVEYLPKFKELNAENLKVLCNSLEKIPCRKEIVPKLASTILQCRSGMMRRKEWTRPAEIKEETWLLFLGAGAESKEKTARGLADIIFGSHADIISIGQCEFSSSNESRSKRSRSEAGGDYLERFAAAIEDDPHRVFLLEDVNQVDYNSRLGILNAIMSGMVRSSTGEGVSVGDAIIIFTCENSDLELRASPPLVKQKYDGEEENNLSVGFDLNLHAADCDDICLVEAVDRTLVFECNDEL